MGPLCNWRRHGRALLDYSQSRIEGLFLDKLAIKSTPIEARG